MLFALHIFIILSTLNPFASYSGIEDQSSTGFAVDLGLQYLLPLSKWSFGFSILNLGTQISSYYSTTEDLPLDIRLGFSKELQHLPFRFYFSFNKNCGRFIHFVADNGTSLRS